MLWCTVFVLIAVFVCNIFVVMLLYLWGVWLDVYRYNCVWCIFIVSDGYHFVDLFEMCNVVINY